MSFASSHRYSLDPDFRLEAPEQEPEEPTATELALRLLSAIAESPLVCGSHRAAARRHLRKLERQATDSDRLA
jgi:hypothetical protein